MCVISFVWCKMLHPKRWGTLGFRDDDDQSNCKREQDIYTASISFYYSCCIFEISRKLENIDYTALKCTVHSFVTGTCIFDSNNSFLYNLYPIAICKSYRGCRTGKRRLYWDYIGKKFDHVSPLLKELHRPHVVKRIRFKFLPLSCRCLNGTTPRYVTFLRPPEQGCAQTFFHVPNNFEVIVPFLWQHLTCCMKAIPHPRFTFS